MADKKKNHQRQESEAAKGRVALEREMAALMQNDPKLEGAILSPHELQILGGDAELQYLLSHQNPSQTISRRIKSINDEVARQRQYLPQNKQTNGKFKGMKNLMVNHPQGSPVKSAKRGSALPMAAHYDERLMPAGALEYHRASEREMRATVASTNTRRMHDTMGGGGGFNTGLSNTKEMFDGYNSPKARHSNKPGSNFKDNLELLQRQQQLQQSLLLEQKTRQFKGIKSPKKKKKMKGGDVEPIWGDEIHNMHGTMYPAVVGASPQIPSSLGILRSGMAGQPLLYDYNTDNSLIQTTNNFGGGSGMGGYNQRTSKMMLESQAAANKSGFPRMSEYAKASTAGLRQKRRNGETTTVPSSSPYNNESGDAYELSRSQAQINASAFGYASGVEQEFTTPILKPGRAIYASGGSRKVDRLREHQRLMDSEKNVVRINEEKMRSPSVSKKVKIADSRFQSEVSKRKKKLRLEEYEMIANKVNEIRSPGAERYITDMPMPAGGYVNYVNGVPVDTRRSKQASPMNRHKHAHGPAGHATTSNLPTIQKSASIARNQPLKDARMASGMSSNPAKAMLASKSKVRVHAIVSNKMDDKNMNNSMTKASKRQLAPMNGMDSEEEGGTRGLSQIRVAERSRRHLKSKAQISTASSKERLNARRGFKSPPDADSTERLQSPHQVNILIQNSTQDMKIMEDLSPARLTSVRQRSLSPQTKITRKRINRSVTKSSLSPKRKGGKLRQSPSPGRGPPVGLAPDPDRTSSYDGHGVRKQGKQKKQQPNNLYRFDERYFRKGPAEPPLFRVDVDELDFEHLKNDDLDEISKMEVTYKILKQQLREHQKNIIAAKDKRKQELAQARMAKKARQRTMSPIDLNRFARHIKHFELYGSQRDLNPELKRIVKNLMCQEHKFMYCPCCKQYEDGPLDPIENIQKFMDYIREEQNKLHKRKSKAQRLRDVKKRKKRLHGSEKKLPDDSASDITYLEEDDILAKYLDETMTKQQRANKERKITQRRLYGLEKKHECHRIGCTTAHKPRPVTPEHRPTVRMELREVQDDISMHDESNSAHQFSLKDMSVQADSEARLDAQMQTSNIDCASIGNQASKQDAHSIVMQTSEIEYKSMQMQTSLFGPNAPRNEICTQTDPKFTRKKTPEKRVKNMQTERLKDMYKEDWLHSHVYKNALRAEAEKRGIPAASLALSDEDSISEDEGNTTSILDRNQSVITIENQKRLIATGQLGTPERRDTENAQDPDTTDAATAHEREVVQHNVCGIRTMGLGFMKQTHEKGNIRVLTESELLYVKKLLKQKNHEYWKEPSTLNDLHRHCKFTIRKLTQKMANIENYSVFKHLKDPTREHTLYLVYRACVLFKAISHSQKIFKLICETIFDQDKFQKIRKNKSITFEDQKFVKRRDLLFKRIITQCNTFLESYKVFDKFTFKNMQIKDYIQQEIQEVSEYKRVMDDIKKANPEAAKKAQDLLQLEQQKSAQVKADFIRNIEKQQDEQRKEKLRLQQQNEQSVEPLSPGDDYLERRVQTSANIEHRLDIERGQENGKVSQETIDVINKQLEAAAATSGMQYDGGKQSTLNSQLNSKVNMAAAADSRVMSPRISNDASPLLNQNDLNGSNLKTDGNEIDNSHNIKQKDVSGVFRGSFGTQELLQGGNNNEVNDQMTPRL